MIGTNYEKMGDINFTASTKILFLLKKVIIAAKQRCVRYHVQRLVPNDQQISKATRTSPIISTKYRKSTFQQVFRYFAWDEIARVAS